MTLCFFFYNNLDDIWHLSVALQRCKLKMYKWRKLNVQLKRNANSYWSILPREILKREIMHLTHLMRENI